MIYISSVFPVKDLGDLNWFLGIHYRHLRDGSILACQKAYIEKYLDKLGLSNVKLRKTPMDTKFKVYESDLDKNPSPELVHSYREKIGGLIWLLVAAAVSAGKRCRALSADKSGELRLVIVCSTNLSDNT